MTAAYSSEWIPRSEPFKSSLKLFVERAKTPITITGLKMFPLSLLTFTSVRRSIISILFPLRSRLYFMKNWAER